MTCSTNSPPISGPRTLPSAHAASTSEKYFGRCRSGTMSAKMTCPMVMMPPPPMPWIERPTKKTVKSLAMGAQRRVPRVKNNTETTSISLRPNMSDSAAVNGWHTAHESRYDVPAQNASVAVPPRSVASLCQAVSAGSSSPGPNQKARTITHRQHRHQDGCVQRHHQGDEGEREHNGILFFPWLPLDLPDHAVLQSGSVETRRRSASGRARIHVGFPSHRRALFLYCRFLRGVNEGLAAIHPGWPTINSSRCDADGVGGFSRAEMATSRTRDGRVEWREESLRTTHGLRSAFDKPQYINLL